MNMREESWAEGFADYAKDNGYILKEDLREYIDIDDVLDYIWRVFEPVELERIADLALKRKEDLIKEV